MRSIHWTTCLAVAVAAALFASGPDVSATEQVLLQGHSCGFDVTEVSPGTYSGHVTGGPVYAGTTRQPVTGVYLLCTIQINAPHHADPDTSLTTAWGVGSASMPPAPVSFRAARTPGARSRPTSAPAGTPPTARPAATSTSTATWSGTARRPGRAA